MCLNSLSGSTLGRQELHTDLDQMGQWAQTLLFLARERPAHMIATSSPGLLSGRWPCMRHNFHTWARCDQKEERMGIEVR